MGKLILILFWIPFALWGQTNYYVSSAGNDANNGTSPETAWKTITKVDAGRNDYEPGDSILFRRGDVFDDRTLRIIASGSAGSPIVYGTYGEGDKPIITSFTELDDWADEGAGIYSHALSIEADQIPGYSTYRRIMVTLDNDVVWMGRWPKTGYNTITDASGNNTLTHEGLGDDPNYEGAEAVVRISSWIINRSKIIDHTGDVLTISQMHSSPPNLTVGYGYFLQADMRFLTAHGDWYYDDTESKLYMYLDAAPATYTIKAATKNTLINITATASYVTFENLSLQGVNYIAFRRTPWTGVSTNVIIQDCDFNYSAGNGIRLRGLQDSEIINNTINNSLDSGIFTDQNPEYPFANCRVINNVIENSGLIPGVSWHLFGPGIHWSGYPSDVTIQYNKVINSGGNGIKVYAGNNIQIRNNFVDNSGLTTDDIGGINAIGLFSNSVIDGNVVINSQGNYEGTIYDFYQAHGIYIDIPVTGINVTNNILAYNRDAGIMTHGSYNLSITGNLMYNNLQRQLIKVNRSPEITEDIVLTDNILIGNNETAPLVRINTHYDDDPHDRFSVIDNNYYLRNDNLTGAFSTYEVNREPTNIHFDFNDWKTYIDGDANSSASALTEETHLIYATYTKKLYKLSAEMDEPDGTTHSGYVLLQPWTGMVLIGDGEVTEVAGKVFTHNGKILHINNKPLIP